MNPTLRNILAIALGAIIGGALNMGIIEISGYIIPPPEGANMKTMEGLKAAMHLMQPKHFIMPFLAHALGTLLGAFIAVKIAATSQFRLGMVLGIIFLAGGIGAVKMLPEAPIWFDAVDLVFAYIPMALLGWKLGVGKK